MKKLTSDPQQVSLFSAGENKKISVGIYTDKQTYQTGLDVLNQLGGDDGDNDEKK